MKVLILLAGGQPLELHPTVLFYGDDQQIAGVMDAINSPLSAANIECSGVNNTTAGAVSVGVATVEDTVEVGDTLDAESFIFKKHV